MPLPDTARPAPATFRLEKLRELGVQLNGQQEHEFARGRAGCPRRSGSLVRKRNPSFVRSFVRPAAGTGNVPAARRVGGGAEKGALSRSCTRTARPSPPSALSSPTQGTGTKTA
ncbi:hypothetical protein NKH18_14995 [Streptomyces sp. M10(2022)]